MTKFPRWIMPLCAIAAVAGCAATTSGDSFCAVSRPIYFDTGESFSAVMDADPALVREVISHNEFHARACG